MNRAERLDEFVRRLSAAPRARSFDEAFGQVFRILNQVEDEYSGVPYNPLASRDDGRLYPPLWDYVRPVQGRSRVTRLRSRGHMTLIGNNGAVEIAEIMSRQQIVSKAGENGLEVYQL